MGEERRERKNPNCENLTPAFLLLRQEERKTKEEGRKKGRRKERKGEENDGEKKKEKENHTIYIINRPYMPDRDRHAMKTSHYACYYYYWDEDHVCVF